MLISPQDRIYKFQNTYSKVAITREWDFHIEIKDKITILFTWNGDASIM